MARGRGTRMRKTWFGSLSGGDGTAITITAVQAAILNVTHLEADIHDVTILRSRGGLFVTATPNAASDADVVGLGLIVVHTNALTVGGASLPGPINDIGADWLWHQFVPLDAISATSADGQSVGLNVRVEVDSKAMRRLQTDHAVVLMAELATGQMTTITVNGGIRFLLGS